MDDLPTTAGSRTGPDAEKQPVIALKKWFIRSTTSGQTFITGWRADGEGADVSLPLVELDMARQSARAASGQEYRLIGPQGAREDAFIAWDIFRTMHRLVDVTGGVLQ